MTEYLCRCDRCGKIEPGNPDRIDKSFNDHYGGNSLPKKWGTAQDIGDLCETCLKKWIELRTSFKTESKK